VFFFFFLTSPFVLKTSANKTPNEDKKKNFIQPQTMMMFHLTVFS